MMVVMVASALLAFLYGFLLLTMAGFKIGLLFSGELCETERHHTMAWSRNSLIWGLALKSKTLHLCMIQEVVEERGRAMNDILFNSREQYEFESCFIRFHVTNNRTEIESQ